MSKFLCGLLGIAPPEPEPKQLAPFKSEVQPASRVAPPPKPVSPVSMDKAATIDELERAYDSARKREPEKIKEHLMSFTIRHGELLATKENQ